MKWLIGSRSLVTVSFFALLLGSRYMRLGLDLELGVLFGIANMWFMMWANERFLDGRVSRSRRSLETFVRLTAVGSLLAFTLYWGPWWAIALALAGLYTPHLLYSYELTKSYRTGKL